MQVKLTSEAATQDPNYKQVAFQIAGKSPAQVDIKKLSNQFIQALFASPIDNVETTLTSGDTSQDMEPFTVTGDVDVSFTAQADITNVLNQILALWIQTYGKSGRWEIRKRGLAFNLAKTLPAP